MNGVGVPTRLDYEDRSWLNEQTGADWVTLILTYNNVHKILSSYHGTHEK